MSSIEEKLKELQTLAGELKEAKEKVAVKPTDTSDEPEGSKGGEAKPAGDIVPDDEGGENKGNKPDAESDDIAKKKKAEMDESKKVQMVAETVKAVEDLKARQALAEGHAQEFAKADPRFNHALFHAACGTKNEKAEVTESTKEVVKIDLAPLFEGQELSAEFILKATAIFESAVAQRIDAEIEALYESVAEETNALQESLEQAALEEATALEESLVEKVDGYLDYMVEQWMEKNALAFDRGIKTEMLESFVGGLKDLFTSHYIDVPDEKYDLIEAAQTETHELESLLDEAVQENIRLRAEIKDTARMIQIESATDGLVETDAEKFRQLAESIQFVSQEDFAKKLDVVKETYFKKPTITEAKKPEGDFMTDAPVASLNEDAGAAVNPQMARYVAAINQPRF